MGHRAAGMSQPSPPNKDTMGMNGLIDTQAIKAVHKESWYAEELVEMSGVHLCLVERQ